MPFVLWRSIRTESRSVGRTVLRFERWDRRPREELYKCARTVAGLGCPDVDKLKSKRSGGQRGVLVVMKRLSTVVCAVLIDGNNNRRMTPTRATLKPLSRSVLTDEDAVVNDVDVFPSLCRHDGNVSFGLGQVFIVVCSHRMTRIKPRVNTQSVVIHFRRQTSICHSDERRFSRPKEEID
mgnify:CR=1 FL=1